MPLLNIIHQRLTGGKCATHMHYFSVFVLVTLDATIYSFLWMRQYFVFRTTIFRSKAEKIFVRSLQWVSMSLIVGIYASSSGEADYLKRISTDNGR